MQETGTNWPRPDYDPDNEPHFIFIITPPYSGSTALCKLFNTSHRSMLLHPRGEGQWLIPGLCGDDRWDADLHVDYESVRAVWLSRFQRIQRLTQTTDVVIEKSPANLVRMEALAAHFKSCSFIANNRNPYANCASILYRQYRAEEIPPLQRAEILVGLAQEWNMRSRLIMDLVQRLSIPLISYEEFCEKPAAAIDALRVPMGIAESMDPEAEVQVKEYQPQKIHSFNERQINQLTANDIEVLNAVLAEAPELLSFFSYPLLQADG